RWRAGLEPTAAELADVEQPYPPVAHPHHSKVHDRVSDGELRHRRDLGFAVFPHPERGGRDRGQPSRQVMQELPELTGPAGERLQRLEAADDNHSGAPFPEEGPDLAR